jgi:3-dehydroquinate dehydratase
MQGNLLDQAKELLKKAEKTTDPRSKKTQCECALDILDEIMEGEPKEEEIVIINNHRFSRSFNRHLG